MGRKFEEYRIVDGRTRFAAADLNPRLESIDQRLHAQEVIEKDWRAAVSEITAVGLQRIDDVLLPALQEISQLTSLGFLQARVDSGADVAWATGYQQASISVETDDDKTRAKLFKPSPFVVIADNDDPLVYLIARVVSYTPTVVDNAVTAAVLAFDVQQVVGSPAGGAVTAPWILSSPAATALLFQATEDAVAARDVATAARDTAVSARDVATTARDQAQTSRSLTLGYRDDAKTYRDEAKAYRDETVTVAGFDIADAEALAFEQALLWGS